jgi:pimeloyl-ACP methyl ester carboxylesterase
MTERTVRANGIEIWCEDFGSKSDPALLLVMGASAQGLLWPDEFCNALASAGRHVIRFDNRDTGQSTCFDFATSPYTLSDMARDAVGLLDALDIERAHVAGASMGGMIGQTLAIEHGPRLRTLTSIMSSPAGTSILTGMMGGVSALPGPEPKVMEAVAASAANPPRTTAERIDAAVRLWRALSGSGEPFDEAAVRAREALMQARAKNPDASRPQRVTAWGDDPDARDPRQRGSDPSAAARPRHRRRDPRREAPRDRGHGPRHPGARAETDRAGDRGAHRGALTSGYAAELSSHSFGGRRVTQRVWRS